MEIKVETKFIPLVFELKNNVPDGVDVFVPPVKLQRSVDSQDLALAVITVAMGVPTSLLASRLYEKIKGKEQYTKITINRKEIYCDKAQITRILEEQMQIEQRQTADDKTAE